MERNVNYKFNENAIISGNIAADGMVLLENRDELLPLKRGTRIAVYGSGQMEYSMCGIGSGSVLTAYRIDLVKGLLEAEKDGKLRLDRKVMDSYSEILTDQQTAVTNLAEMAGIDDAKSTRENQIVIPCESLKEINAAAGRNDAALFIISRNAGEGGDRCDVPGDYRLSSDEEELLNKLISSDFKKIAVVVNSGGLIDLAWFRRSEKLKSLLMAWQPGMLGGRALAKVLCGEVNPSGRLTDTVAKSYSAYPTSRIFKKNNFEMVYEEDIFVGYRYFETVPSAKDKVLYPFGFGLSYTSFETVVKFFDCDGKIVRCEVAVTNTGKYPGREVVQLYSSRTGGKMEYPAKELRNFAKTGVIAPGETQYVVLLSDFNDLAAFDDTGISGAPIGSFVLEAGHFTFHVGSHVRNTQPAGKYTLAKTTVLSSPGLILQNGLRKRMHADGSFTTMPFAVPSADEDMPYEKETNNAIQPIMLSDVASGRYTLEEFISQLNRKELMHLSFGQDAFTTGSTGGIGNIRRYGIPNPQTADGPAGVHRLVPTTGFPCGVLIASSWDEELQYLMGDILGKEAVAFDVDILLAPALNIHRDVMCGRNFEYFSEDPLLSGRTAANIVNGIQSQNVGATLKHFAVNSRENRRKFTNSIVSERALREIYLKGFEIAIKKSSPWCVMSAYNLVNGKKCSCNNELLGRILRDEWRFDGLVMTDWVTHSHLWQEIVAGNDVKMPGRELDIHRETAYMDRDFHLIPRKVLERNATRILRVIMKTNRFRNNNFGRIYPLDGKDILRISAAEMSSVMVANSNIAPCSEGGKCHCHLMTLAHGNYKQRLTFMLNAKRAERYQVSFRLAADRPGSFIELYIDDNRAGLLEITPTCPRRTADEEKADPNSNNLQTWETQGSIFAEIPAGESDLCVFIDTAPDNATGVNLNYVELIPCI